MKKNKMRTMSELLFLCRNKRKKTFCASAMVSVCEDKKNLKNFQKEICKIIQPALFKLKTNCVA